MSLIAQYIENYLDLIENSPNEIIRQITRLHEKNHLYSKLNDKLEETLKILVDNGPPKDDESTKQVESKQDVNKQDENKRVEDKQDDKLTTADKSTSDRQADRRLEDESSTDKRTADQSLTDKSSIENASTDQTSTNQTSTNLTSTNQTRIDQTLIDKISTDQDNRSSADEDEKITLRKQKALNSVKRYLLEIQEIADEKLNIVQSILEHLDYKNKQLDIDYRSLSSQNVNNTNNTKSNSNSSSQNTNDEDSLSGNQENSNNELNYQKEEQRPANAVQSSSQSSSVNNHHSSNSKRASSRRNMNTGKQEFNSNELNVSHNGSNSNNNNGNSSSNHHKRGVKRGVNKSSNKEIKRNRSSSTRDLANSPSNLYDDPPIDPDEPTYCICEQVSFGEMICCDNAACDIEWFHLSCIGITRPPKGKWYCVNCRGDRSNIPKK